MFIIANACSCVELQIILRMFNDIIAKTDLNFEESIQQSKIFFRKFIIYDAKVCFKILKEEDVIGL